MKKLIFIIIAVSILCFLLIKRNNRLELEDLSARACWLTTKQQLSRKAKEKVEEMIANAENDGMCLVVMSGYRSPERQAELLEMASPEEKKYIAQPEESEHQTGTAVDLTACPMKDGKRDDTVERLELKKDFNELPEYQWMLENAHKYGFYESYPEGNGKFPYEPWHWKYKNWLEKLISERR